MFQRIYVADFQRIPTVYAMDKQEPYRATKLWNEVIRDFRNGMPLKRHRRNIQFYTECFSASECTTWLHCYLINSPNFGCDVTRQQAIQLLQKFLKCHVIESITLKSKKYELFDNSHLYRFTQLSPVPSKNFPLQQIQSPVSSQAPERIPKTIEKQVPNTKGAFKEQKENIPECHFIQRELSVNQINDAWKNVALLKLERFLPSLFNDVLEDKLLNGSNVKHNVCRLSKTGVVTLIDKTDDIPHWVTSAMKCLVNWPNASGSGSCLPNYPGFEKDVFKVVRDFFINPQVPLLPEYISNPLLQIYCTLTKKQCIEMCCDRSQTASEPQWTPASGELISNRSVNDVIITSTPIIFADLINAGNSKLCKSVEGRILLDDPEVMWEYPSNVCFETEFTTNKPVTRIISETKSLSDLCRSNAPSLLSLNSVSTISVCSQFCLDPDSGFSYERSPPKLWNSSIELNDRISKQQSQVMVNLNSSSRSGTMSVSLGSLQVKNKPFQERANPLPHVGCDVNDSILLPDYNECDYENAQFNDSILSTRTIMGNEDAVSVEANVLVHEKSRIGASDHRLSPWHDDNKGEKEKFENVDQSVSRKRVEDEKDLVSAFQLLLLFLPPPNRRQLHLLFRIMNKIVKNGKFIIDVPISMRDYLLETFLPAIVKSDLDQKILFSMTSFILDNCEAIFQPPNAVKEEAEQWLMRASSGKIKYSLDDSCFLTYCKLVSKQQYEQQKASVSEQALRELLENVIRDTSISERERRKKLKKFKENHPEIYFLCFPQPVEDAKRKPRKTFLNKLANLRM